MASVSREREVAFDCRFFLGDRPCIWHKSAGVVCRCDHYAQVKERVLIIKLDAMGDVLRTTALLPALASAHPLGTLTWLTRRESLQLLLRNPYLSETLEYGPDALLQLQARQFDRVINLDAGRTSAALASVAHSSRKDGFVLDPGGAVRPTNFWARRWLEAGVFDDIKKAGADTYQTVMARILGLEEHTHRYVLELTAAERSAGREHLASLGIDTTKPVVGLNTGAGGRWPLKQWREDGYLELIERLWQKYGLQPVLLGGPAERERHRRLTANCGVPLYDAGCENAVRHFAAIVGACDLVITGDTLAMHIALALDRRIVVLFGPTSAPEIELYGLGDKVVPTMDCLACYKTHCDFAPNCMDLISTSMVEAAVEWQLHALAIIGN